MVDKLDQRLHARRALSTEGEIADALGENWFPIKLTNLSLGGLGFLTLQRLQSGQLRLIRVPVANGEVQLLRVTIKIAHCLRHSLFDGYRVGAEFIDLDMQQSVLIEKMLTRSRAEKCGIAPEIS